MTDQSKQALIVAIIYAALYGWVLWDMVWPS